MYKQNWFDTLNQSLESENLIDYWQFGLNISYGETVRIVSNGLLISITRDNSGRYERPVFYSV
jgi:hypothetical protein